MPYTIDRIVSGDVPGVVERTIAALKSEGFGVLTDIDIATTLKAKLNVKFRPYRILGACNPPLAHRALTAERKIGAMLPCNVIVQEASAGQVEVSAIDPGIGMQLVGNPEVSAIAAEVSDKLKRVIERI
jgi:uncharacterized protein (DUF302 family)